MHFKTLFLQHHSWCIKCAVHNAKMILLKKQQGHDDWRPFDQHNTHTHTHAYARTHIHIRRHTHAFSHTRKDARIHARADNTHTHTHTHARTHARTQAQPSGKDTFRCARLCLTNHCTWAWTGSAWIRALTWSLPVQTAMQYRILMSHMCKISQYWSLKPGAG